MTPRSSRPQLRCRRRGRDSNPREASTAPTRLAGGRTRPLCDPPRPGNTSSKYSPSLRAEPWQPIRVETHRDGHADADRVPRTTVYVAHQDDLIVGAVQAHVSDDIRHVFGEGGIERAVGHDETLDYAGARQLWPGTGPCAAAWTDA